jgi:peptidyl-tRNA hydrolase
MDSFENEVVGETVVILSPSHIMNGSGTVARPFHHQYAVVINDMMAVTVLQQIILAALT